MVNWDQHRCRYSGEVKQRFHFLSLATPIEPLVRWNCVAFSLKFTQPWAVSRWDRWDRRAPSSDSCPPTPSHPIPSHPAPRTFSSGRVSCITIVAAVALSLHSHRSDHCCLTIKLAEDRISFALFTCPCLAEWQKSHKIWLEGKKATYNSMTNYVCLILKCTKTILTR